MLLLNLLHIFHGQMMIQESSFDARECESKVVDEENVKKDLNDVEYIKKILITRLTSCEINSWKETKNRDAIIHKIK